MEKKSTHLENYRFYVYLFFRLKQMYKSKDLEILYSCFKIIIHLNLWIPFHLGEMLLLFQSL